MNKAYNCAVGLLTRREHGNKELVSKLAQKGYVDSEIEAALTELIRLDLQSDERFVDMFCKTRINQGYGPERIRQELKNKQIDSDLIEVKIATENDNWVSYAVGVWRKKYDQQGEYSYPERQKQKQFLFYRGFPMHIIAVVFECLS
jgi:regulatory protein